MLCLSFLLVALLTVHAYAVSNRSASNSKTYSKSEIRIGIRNETIKEFVDRLFSGYNGNIPPSTYDGTITTVQVGVYILDFGSLDLVNMDYSVTMFLRQIWRDPRLAYSDYNKSLALNYMRPRMWVPDLYFINEKQSKMHELTTPNLLMRLHPDGRIVYSQKITVRLWCLMDLRKFPLDTQNCEMKMESYGYSVEEVKLEWVNGTGNALQFAHKQLSEYELLAERVGHCTEKYYTGAYSCLNVTFHMERKFGYYLIQTYIPTVLIVILSWVSFWIDVNAVPARISVGLLTVLSMTTQSSGMRAQLPRVSYVKAIDVWQSVSLVFVFGALIEFAIANFSQRLRDRTENVRTEYDKDGVRRRCGSLAGVPLLFGKSKSKVKTKAKKRTPRAFAHRPTPNFYRKPSLIFDLEQRGTPPSTIRSCEAPFEDGETSFLWRRRPNEASGPSNCSLGPPHNGHWNPGASEEGLGAQPEGLAVQPSNGGAKIQSNVDSIPRLPTPTSCEGVVYFLCETIDKNSQSVVVDVAEDLMMTECCAETQPWDGSKTGSLSPASRLMESDRIDQMARYLFPAAFLIFNMFYWLYYLLVK